MPADAPGQPPAPSLLVLARDWTDLSAWPAAAFDVALGADVIYEPEACEAIAALLAKTLRPGGTFLLADGKGRRNRAKLWAALHHGGFALEEERWVEVGAGVAADAPARGTLDRRLRAEAEAEGSTQSVSVYLARFVLQS